MLKKIILMESGNQYQGDTIEEIVGKLIDENYYNLSPEEKKEKIRMKALANSLHGNIEIVEELNKNTELEGKLIIKDEITYILSLLMLNTVIMLERKDADLFTKGLDKSKIEDNYVIVNTFAKELLKNYI